MAKFVPDSTLDGFLDYIQTRCTRVTICSTQPTTFTQANATNALADVTVSSGSFSKANGDTSGRKLTLAQQTGVAIDTTGSAQHIALLDVTNSALLAVTTCTTQSVTVGNTATINAFDIEIADAI